MPQSSIYRNEKKTRIYFVDDDAIRSQRGHAMIVVYDKDTVTGLHHHPNAESMFVMLEGGGNVLYSRQWVGGRQGGASDALYSV